MLHVRGAILDFCLTVTVACIATRVRMSSAAAMSEEKKTSKFLHCELCNAYVPNQASMDAHLKGKRHVQNVEMIKNREEEAKKSIFVSAMRNLNAAELSLTDHFSKYGPVAKITVDKTRGAFAILEFSEEESATKALAEKQHVVEGEVIIVKPRELKAPAVKKSSATESSHIVHNRMPPEVWKALLSAADTESQFHVLHTQLSLTEDDNHIRDLVCQLLKAALEEVFHSCEIQPFGSSMNGFGVHGCDLDLNFHYESVDYQAAMEFLTRDSDLDSSFKDENQNKALNKKQTLAAVASIIKKCVPDCHQVKAILSARRPVVKFHHKASQMSCDVSTGNELAVRNTEFLKHLCNKLPYFAPLVQTVRLFMKHWNLAGSARAASALLNNYGVTLLVIFYLYNCEEIYTLDEMRAKDPDFQPCIIEKWDCSFCDMDPNRLDKEKKSLPELFAGFFHFYAKFDFAEKVLCLKTGKQESVAEFKDKDKSESMEHSDSHRLSFKFGPLNIRDPFELDHNVAGNVSRKHMTTFIKCIRNAALACDMKIYTKKPGSAASKEPWGILNLFVDHHAKKSPGPSPKNSFSEKPSFCITVSIKPDQNPRKDIVPLVITILTDVFLVRILDDDITPALRENPSASETTPVQLQKYTKNDDEPQSLEQEGSELSRKRHLEDTPVAQKRARLSLSSPEALNIKCKSLKFCEGDEITLPIEFTGEVEYRVWEGRRKARRILVQPGVSDLLDLERQISKLLVSESKSFEQDSSKPSSAKDAIQDLKTYFQFHATVCEDRGKAILLGFELRSSENKTIRNQEQDFKNFFHHLELSLPNMVAKCLKAV